MSKNSKKKPGTKPEHVIADGVAWQEAMKHALQKPKPKKGWAEAEVTPPDENSAIDGN